MSEFTDGECGVMPEKKRLTIEDAIAVIEAAGFNGRADRGHVYVTRADGHEQYTWTIVGGTVWEEHLLSAIERCRNGPSEYDVVMGALRKLGEIEPPGEPLVQVVRRYIIKLRLASDSNSRPQGEDSRSEAEGEARQRGGTQ